MPILENIENIFSILHDGIISEWRGDKSMLNLTVECEYLAEQIDKSFDRFYIQLDDIDKIELDPWTNLSDLPSIIKTEIADIFQADLEISSADIENDAVLISCHQHDKSFDYSGGNLTLSCQSIKVFDQKKNELTIEQFGEICKDYWNQ